MSEQYSLGAYNDSFLGLPNQTVYYDAVNNFDLRLALKNALYKYHSGYIAQEAHLKATTTQSGGTGTAGYALIPVFVDPVLVDRTRKFTPIRNVIKRVTNYGITADFNVITSKGGAFCAAEDPSMTETNTTYDRSSTAIKYLYAVGRVTGQALAAVPGYNLVGANVTGTGTMSAGIETINAPNVMQLETMVKMRELVELEEGLIIKGNATTSAFSQNPNGTEFSGISTIMSTTNSYDATGKTLTEDMINEAIQYSYDDSGRVAFAICDSATYRDIMGILADKKILYNTVMNTEYGTTGITWYGMTGAVVIYPSQFLTNSTGSKSMYFIDPEVWEMRVLQDITFQEMGITGDSRKFFLKEYVALICRAVTFNSSILNLV